MDKSEIMDGLRALYFVFRGDKELREKVKDITDVNGEGSIDPVEYLKEAYLYMNKE